MRAYLNMGLAKKLFLALMIIAILAMAIGGLGMNATSRLSTEAQTIYQMHTLPMQHLAVMYDTLASQRVCANNAVIFREHNPQFSSEELAAIAEKEALFDDALKEYSQVLSYEDDEDVLYNNIYQLYYNEFKGIKDNVKAALASGNQRAMSDAIFAMDSMGATISGYMDEAFALNDRLAWEKAEATEALHQSVTVILAVSMGVGALFAVCFAVYLSRIISRPINRIKTITSQVAETGNLQFSPETIRAIRQDAQYTDETGQLAAAFAAMMDAFLEKIKILEAVAGGDLTAEIPLAGAQDTLGNALEHMVSSLNTLFGQINSSAAQVSTGSRQMADSAQALAQGSTEQASAIEEFSASVEEIAEKTRQNAAIAREAAALSDSIRGNAEKGSTQMERMMRAVKEISDASGQIEKVIKVIDDIAFQTNILALNAAVEAARAGQHGRGFAVVAEEVRNLAAKSAEAAKDTGGLIQNSISKANLGLNIATETSASLKEIVEGVNRSAEIVTQIARASDEQAGAIGQINTGIDQVAQVVHQNSATAEESAAASEEMSGQSDMLERLIAQFKVKNTIPIPVLGLPAGERVPALSAPAGKREKY